MFSIFNKRKRKDKPQKQPITKKKESTIMEKSKSIKFSFDLQSNSKLFKQLFQKDMDFLAREFTVFGQTPAVLICIKSIVDMEKINHDIIKQLQRKQNPPQDTTIHSYIEKEVLYYLDVKEEKSFTNSVEALLAGSALVFIDGQEEAIVLDVYSQEKRGIEQPETEQVIRGSRDGFIESIQTNISLLRYRLPVPEFRIEQSEVGTRTKTKISICYLEDVVEPELLESVKARIRNIDIDRVLDAGYIEQFIQDEISSPFPQVINTERPDKAIGNILEGRICILVDGSPFVLIVPATFTQFYQTSEDYNERWLITSTLRLVRLAALVFSLTFSSFYVAVLSFHPELIPASFVVAASSGRQGVPFSAVIEVLIMEFAMEILREATVRMPQQVGGALSIVGVLVVGQAAVQAGFVSPITVVIMAISTIGSFATPSYNVATAFRLLRFVLIILSGILGLLGLAIGLMLVINHMLSLRSFGVPYMSPFSPGSSKGIKDSLIHFPLQLLQLNNKKQKQHHKNNDTEGGGQDG